MLCLGPPRSAPEPPGGTSQPETESETEPEVASEQPRSAAYADVLVPLPEAERDEAQGKKLMAAAKAAFGDERFEEAIEFLAEAYRTYPYVTLLYSLGSAHRRAYERDGDVEHRRLSIRRYQQYLSAAPDAEFADLAQNYLTSLLAERDLVSMEAEAVTRVLVSTTAEDATMSLDGAPPLPAPGVITVEPGSHELHVLAPGYQEFVRTIDVPEGATYMVQADLDALPGTITVVGPKRATVRLDGVVVGQLPLAEPLRVEPGAHVIGVSQRGRDPMRVELDIERAGHRSVAADLGVSNQRVVSYLLLGLGAVGLASTGVLFGLTYDRQIRAQQFTDRLSDGELSTAEYQRYRELADQRDSFRAGALLTGLGSSGLFLAGIVLFAYESPRAIERLARVQPTPTGLAIRF